MTRVIPAHAGLPDITFLFTSDEREAAMFIQGWSGHYHFGLDLEWRPVFQKGEYARASTLQVCAGPWVLVFDLKALGARPLPDTLWHFLENEKHCFYGMGLLEDLTRLAFEFDCVVAGIDFASKKTWPGLKMGGGLAGLANRVLGTSVQQSKAITMSNWEKRPLSEKQLQYAVEDAYLSWKVARHFIREEFPHEEWLVSMAQMYGSGRKRFGNPGIMSLQHLCHDWDSAKADFERNEDKKIQEREAKRAEREKNNGTATY
eukprot:CAMPEP_0117528790 /NCGR_PEP_ID=MMETSP0784-20121206/37498_1 /TAXON_ID=39447 /ORGANISM="" /LENGTH=259 /DNA_ID=CAMNT_0005325091 /DNA_START=60 /DNA_END=839 /DNA_ORIENTATION=-